MGLEHLSDVEYDALKTRGLTALNDDAYERLKLPKGYGMQAKPEPEPEASPQQKVLSEVNDKLLGDNFVGGVGLAPMMVNGLQAIAETGKFAAGGLKQLGGLVGPKTERAVDIASDFLLPKTKASAAMTLMGGTGAKATGKAMVSGASGRAVKMIRPNTAEKVAGGAIQATARVPERFGSAVVADPSILDEAVTPSLKSVSKEMGAYFKSKGAKINSEKMGDLFGQDYVPSDNQVSKLNKMVDTVLNKIRDGVKVSDEELVFAERAANGIKRSTGAQTNKYLMSKAAGAQKVLMDALDNAGFTELPDLKAKYFRALAQDAFTDWLPRNKTGGPNALSSLLMGKQAVDALGNLAQGEVGKAVGNAAQAAAFSPVLVGQGIRAASKLGPAAGQTTKAVTMATLNQMGKKKKDERPKP